MGRCFSKPFFPEVVGTFDSIAQSQCPLPFLVFSLLPVGGGLGLMLGAMSAQMMQVLLSLRVCLYHEELT